MLSSLPKNSLSPKLPKDSSAPAKPLTIRPKKLSIKPKMPFMPDGSKLTYKTASLNYRTSHIIYKKNIIIPKGIALVNAPIFLDIYDNIITNPPPDKCHISDLTVFQILISGITNRNRHDRWPITFKSNSYIIKSRPNFSKAATIKDKQDGITYDLIYQAFYILYSDLGANEKEDNKP